MVDVPPLPQGLPRGRRERVANELHSLAIHLLRYVRHSDTASGLSAPRLSLLSVLVFAGPQSVSRLAAMEQVSVAAATKLSQGLERDGLVERRRDGPDQRVVTLTATPAGHAVLERARADRLAAIAELLGELPPADLATVQTAVRTLRQHLAAKGRDQES